LGFFSKLWEDSLKVRFVKNSGEYTGIPITDDSEDITQRQINDVDAGSLIDSEAISKFRTLSSDRNEKYAAYEDMLKDATTAAAIEMYADDATQYDPKTGKIIWAESEDPNIAKAANRLIDVLQLNEKAWQYCYALCTYGDIYLRIYRKGDNADYEDLINTQPGIIRTKVQDVTRPMEEYVEYVEDPATIYDLQLKGKTCGFVRIKTNATTTQNSYIHNGMNLNQVNVENIDFYDRRSFVHISLSESINRNPEYLAVNDTNKGKTTVYKVKSGKSILEDAYEASQTVKLLEDSMLLSRLTKAPLVRLLEVEVGDTPKPEVEGLLRRIKNMIEQKIAMNTNSGESRSYNSPGPMENVVYIPVKNGKGAITVNTLGGDINVKDIADIDYFNNKKLSALKTPKQFLNYDSPEGLGNGTSLTRVSSRYAHTVMRVQNALISGVTTLLNLYFLDKNLEYINKFNIKMVSPSTIEDIERDEQMSNRINQVGDIMQLISEVVTDKGKLETLESLLCTYLNLSEVSGIVDKYNILENEDVSDEDIDFDGDYGDDGGINLNYNMNEPSEPPISSPTEFDSYESDTDTEYDTDETSNITPET
jgi:hypothetical protein